jgi:hypothetical protein
VLLELLLELLELLEELLELEEELLESIELLEEELLEATVSKLIDSPSFSTTIILPLESQ